MTANQMSSALNDHKPQQTMGQYDRRPNVKGLNYSRPPVKHLVCGLLRPITSTVIWII